MNCLYTIIRQNNTSLWYYRKSRVVLNIGLGGYDGQRKIKGASWESRVKEYDVALEHLTVMDRTPVRKKFER